MANGQISEEEVMRIAEEVRERFLQEHSESDKFDPRDLQRVRTDLEYVAKFTRQQRGNHDNIINQMVESLKWRHSFGVNDIQFEDIEDYLWRSGMAFNHGIDKQGHHIVVLNIRLHRKDSKKAVALQRWISFCFESHRIVNPKGRMCMIFDMTGSGLSQMDMDLMRFIVNCFKIYFPDILGVLLVYNMPWILQAAWKIVQSWLSEGAVAKVKFVNSETIRQYVSPEELLAQFGGTDPWQFDYDREREVMLGQLQAALEREEGEREEREREEREREEKEREEREREERENSSQMQSTEVHSSDMEQNHQSGDSLSSEDDQGRGERGEGGRGADGTTGEEGRKVRFSANLPPSRQSRYGFDDEREAERQKMVSPDDQQLLQGSAASQGFRRRQVHKLMSLQTDPRGQRSPITTETNHRNDNRRMSEPLLSTSPFSHIQLIPVNELVFTGPRDRELLCTLSLTNTSHDSPALFKIKTTAPRRYKVRPNLSLVHPNGVTRVQVLLVAGSQGVAISEDKFLVQIYSFPVSATVPSPDQLTSYWKSLSDKDITEHRMRCRWVKEETPSLAPSPALTSTPLPQSPPTATPPPTTTQLQQRDLRNINDKLEKLVKANQDLTTRVSRLSCWIFLLLVLVTVLLLKTLLLA